MLAAGEGTQLSAEALDASGQPIGGADLSFTSSDPSKLSVSPTGFVRSEGPRGKADIIVTSGVHQTRAAVTITAGPPHVVDPIAGDQQSGEVQAQLPQPIVVRILDASGNVISGAPIIFAAADGGIADPTQEKTDDRGDATSRWTLGPAAGAQTLLATVGGANVSARFTARAQSGPPAKLLALEGARTTIAPGESCPLAVRVTDAHGNGETGANVHWRVEAGGGKLSSQTSTTDDSGVARVILTAGNRPAENRVIASTTDLSARIGVLAK